MIYSIPQFCYPGHVLTKGDRSRQAILAAAVERFGREGYRATSVADIARDASVSGTLAYAYFPSKEALFLAAADEDAAGVMNEGLSSLIDAGIDEWREQLMFTLLDAVDRHPLARRILGGLEPAVTERVLEVPALAELRKACAERLRGEQLEGTVRSDIDPVVLGNGVVSILLSLLMSTVQIGRTAAQTYGADVAAVFEAAIRPPASGARSARRAAPTRGATQAASSPRRGRKTTD